MNKQEWQDKKKYCIDNAETINKVDKRLEDEDGVQFVPFTTEYIPSVPVAFIFVTENEIIGGAKDWRVNSTSEYLLVDGVKIQESDCTEVI
jgi:hypothetical protein